MSDIYETVMALSKSGKRSSLLRNHLAECGIIIPKALVGKKSNRLQSGDPAPDEWRINALVEGSHTAMADITFATKNGKVHNFTIAGGITNPEKYTGVPVQKPSAVFSPNGTLVKL